MSWWKRASWSKTPEEPKNPELAAGKQLPGESLKLEQLEKLMLKGQDAPEPRQIWRRQRRSQPGGPEEVLGISTQSISQRLENQSSTTNKLPVEVNHPKKPLQGWVVSGWRKSSDGR